jgi:hippurate hydrolase
MTRTVSPARVQVLKPNSAPTALSTLGPVTGSEEIGILARAAGVPCVYWLLGGADPQEFAGATDLAAIQKIVASLPSNHSPLFAPVIEPTLQTGVAALVRAAHTWLPVSVQ